MKSSINTIKFLVMLSVVLLLVTYSISLNDENRWIVFDTSWLSNSFAFAIASGSFASSLVVLVCELQKYLSIKRQTEDYIYSQLFNLYAQITIIHYNTKRQLNDIASPVPSNLIDEIANRGKMCLNNLASIEYVTFCKQNTIKAELTQYKGKNGMRILSFLQDSIFLKMAINEDRIIKLKQEGRDELTTSTAPNTHLTLKKIFKDSSVILTHIEESLNNINKECKNRYNWSDVKRNIISGEENYISTDLSTYLSHPTIQLETI